MPISMDRHAVQGTTPEALARYGCKYFTCWFAEKRQSIFCLIVAPSRQAVQDMHRAAHGMPSTQIIEEDGAAFDLLQAHQTIIGQALVAHCGREEDRR